ncbi:MAG TPA: rhodanese-like domain-containing protein [Gaiellaceae bacterium]|jgi:glyoxylase-like metal-dependent hydrolase (beta-lactamase superfamily II)/rhodanese-related sulfurtransferase
MIFRQFVDEDLGCGSYLVGDSGVAVLVDPSFRIEQYLVAADELGVTIERVLETHTHADHVSGHGRLAGEHGLPVAIHSLADAEFPHEALQDGDVVRVGAIEIRVLHTPGHRPEHCAFVVDGKIVLTGDSLFVGDAARPDLAVAARKGAEDLFQSLRKLEALGDEVEVYPGHVAGSLCGGNMSSDRSTTIGRERASNEALSLREMQEFVMASASLTTPRPPTTERVVALNRGPWVGLPTLPSQLDDGDGATVLDVRPFADHAAGHVHGAINVPVSGSSFGTKAGFVLLPDEPVVVHARTAEEAAAAAWKLWAVGLLEIAGYVLDTPAPEQLATVDVAELKRLLDEDEVQLVDVREAGERDDAYIPGSRNVPYRLLRKLRGDGLEPDKTVVTICESGARAGIAASLLQREGFDVRAVSPGGIPDFTGEIVSFRRCGS